MDWDYSRQREKEAELTAQTGDALKQLGVDHGAAQALAKRIVSVCVTSTPPEREVVLCHLVTLAPGGRGGGRSSKLGNIRLDAGKLMQALS